ncbi:MAG: helix-turn-helix transcriptional regulator [Aestuariivirga sp.]
MQESEQVSALIGGIYDTVLDPGLWPPVLKSLSGFVGGAASALYAKDPVGKGGAVFHDDGGIPQHYHQLYFEKYIKLDPSSTAQFCFELEEPFATADFMPYNEFLETRFYKEWGKPQQLVDHIAATLDKSAAGMALFGVFRHERHGLANDETRRRMRLVVPHVRRAVLIGRVMEFKSTEVAAFADTLDSLAAGVFLVDVERRVMHANAAGFALIAASDIVQVADGRLSLMDPEFMQALLGVLAAGIGADASPAGQTVARALVARDGTRYAANILPLASGLRRRAGATYKAVAALFIHAATLEPAPPAAVIARTWKLTPTELRVLLAIVEVGGVPDVAVALGIAETTVKTHLSHLYAKTGTHRQVDLVKLVAGFSSPLLD